MTILRPSRRNLNKRINTPEQYRQIMKTAPKRMQENFKRYIANAKSDSLNRRWNDKRTYETYDGFFKVALGMPIFDFIIHRANTEKKRQLTILDDGLGAGLFLETLNRKLKSSGINANLEGCTLTETTPLLQFQSENPDIKIRTGIAQLEKTPDKYYDMIFSMYGSVSYTPQYFRKYHLLKLAYSLRENGVLLSGFLLNPELLVPSSHVVTGFSPRQKVPEEIRELSIHREMSGIVESFRKRGFEARFIRNIPVETVIEQDIPNTILYVRRMTAEEFKKVQAEISSKEQRKK